MLEFMKLPALLVHYYEHKELNSELSFSEYIHLHYAHNGDFDNDYTSDKKLPFKTMEHSYASTLSQCIPHVHQLLSFHSTDHERSYVDRYHVCLHSNSFTNAIWQPPKTI
jgi:hypothetical protein